MCPQSEIVLWGHFFMNYQKPTADGFYKFTRLCVWCGYKYSASSFTSMFGLCGDLLMNLKAVYFQNSGKIMREYHPEYGNFITSFCKSNTLMAQNNDY